MAALDFSAARVALWKRRGACWTFFSLRRYQFARWERRGCIVSTTSRLAISSNEFDIAPNGVLFREIKALTLLNFTSFLISFCPRACNKVADALASFGAKMVSDPQAVWPG